ncbi:DUF427 domain-containing protein [Jiangella asiatica]|uniref:DUF427 domain-containing protein n=1 Tax=Jiangella asiatica TaxID=2530372 RepID=A0A4R5DPW9_9ACTN|nr:DUF427 domain-containing protein [Jiangella asiatica]TDE14220.1 DUF427 domain-containing protein [Jiangella asiatica]
MKVTIDGAVIAEAAGDDVVKIEGNWYFPPSSITPGTLSESPKPYICAWKGVAQYYDVAAPRGTRKDAAWSYPDPLESAADAVGRNFAGYVAFDRAFATIS